MASLLRALHRFGAGVPRDGDAFDASLGIAATALHYNQAGVWEMRDPVTQCPLRIFYPTSNESGGGVEAVPVFRHNGRLDRFLAGFVHTARRNFRKRHPTIFWLVCVILRIVCWFVPGAYECVPGAVAGAEPAQDGPFPLVMFSHGLTGTGEEHAMLHAAWARQGYVVVSITHLDGSCSVADTSSDGDGDGDGDGVSRLLWYEHPPGMAGVEGKYPPDWRQRQVQSRADELHAATQFVLEGGFPASLRAVVDGASVIAAGFSYGGATAALVCHTHPRAPYGGALLLDAWLNLNLASIKNCDSNEQAPFPRAVHARGLSVPTCLIGSATFKSHTEVKTAALAAKTAARTGGRVSRHTLAGTAHHNFIDLCWWVHPRLVTRWWLGPGPARERYAELAQLSLGFFGRVAGRVEWKEGGIGVVE